jgi:hypothetical protein
LYPRSSQGERAELLIDPMEEILGLARSRAAPKPATKQRRFGPLPEYWIHRKAELEAAHEKFEAEFRAMATAAAAQEPDPGEWYSFWNYESRERDDWASVKPVGPPPDPALERDNGWRLPRTNELYRWANRGQLSKLHGTETRFTPRPLDSHRKPKGRPVLQSGRTYLGYESAPVGRPRSNKSEEERKRDKAARQQRLRNRRKGKRYGKETS